MGLSARNTALDGLQDRQRNVRVQAVLRCEQHLGGQHHAHLAARLGIPKAVPVRLGGQPGMHRKLIHDEGVALNRMAEGDKHRATPILKRREKHYLTGAPSQQANPAHGTSRTHQQSQRPARSS